MSTIPDDKPISLYILIFIIFLDSVGCLFCFTLSHGVDRFISGVYFILSAIAAYKMYVFKHDAPEFAIKVYFSASFVSLISITWHRTPWYAFSVFLSIVWTMLIVFWLGRKSVRIHYRRLGYFMQFNDPKQNEEHFN